MTTEAIAREILRCEVGSSAHGTNLPGTDDFDMMGVAVEKPARILTTHSEFEQHIYRSAEERDGKGARSQPGDTDLVVYGLRKFCRLAAKGNPSVLLVLYAPVIDKDDFGDELLKHRDLFISKEAGKRFLGYLVAQKERLLGSRGGLRVTRQELIDAHGYDTKYAMHAIRLGHQGEVLMKTGYMPVPVHGELQDYVQLLRTGQVPFEKAMERIEKQEEDLREALEYTKLPEKADWDAVNDLVLRIYKGAWKRDGFI